MKASEFPRNIVALSTLQDKFAEIVSTVINELQDIGWHPVIASARRSLVEQEQKVKQGYSWTLKSMHLKGLAADIIDSRYGWDGPASNLEFKFWIDLGEIAKKNNLAWGGDWKSPKKDVAHIEMKL